MYGNYRRTYSRASGKRVYSRGNMGSKTIEPTASATNDDICARLEDIQEMLCQFLDLSRTYIAKCNTLSLCHPSKRSNKMAQESSALDEKIGLCSCKEKRRPEMVRLHEERSRDDDADTGDAVAPVESAPVNPECEGKDSTDKGATDSSNKKHRRRDVRV